MLQSMPQALLLADEIDTYPWEAVPSPAWPYPMPASALAEIRIWLLPDGQCEVAATCMHVRDSWYAQKPDAAWPVQVAKLIEELRSQLTDGHSKSTE